MRQFARGPDAEQPPAEPLAALDCWPVATPTPAFVEKLRGKLQSLDLSSKVADGALPPADADDNTEDLTEQLDGWNPPPLTSQQRAQLRQALLPANEAARPARRSARRKHGLRQKPQAARGRRWWLGSGLAAAAALLSATLWWKDSVPRGEQWRLSGDPLTRVLIDQREWSRGRQNGSAEFTPPFETIETLDQGIRLTYSDLVCVELGPNTRLCVEQFTQQGPLIFSITVGSLRFATGPAFTGRELLVRTPQVEARVVGTIFGVDVYPEQGTCICCKESQVAVRALVGAGQSRLVPAGGMDFVDCAGLHSTGIIHPGHSPALDSMVALWHE